MLEFFKQPGIYEASFLLVGVLLHKLLLFAFAITHMAKYYKEVGISSFNIMIMAYLSALTSLEQKERFLKQSGLDEKVIKNILSHDKKEIDQWRDMALKNLYDFAPKVFKKIKEDFDKEGKI